MTLRQVAHAVVRAVVGLGSLLVSAFGFYIFAASGLQHRSPLPIIFSLLPMASFPIFVFGFWRFRQSVMLHCILAVAYLGVYSAMDWRTCAEHGICGSVASTVADALKTHPVEATFAVALLNLAVLLLNPKRQLRST
jgi:hypothetical protein